MCHEALVQLQKAGLEKEGGISHKWNVDYKRYKPPIVICAWDRNVHTCSISKDRLSHDIITTILGLIAEKMLNNKNLN